MLSDKVRKNSMFLRRLKIDLSHGQSCFLWGARQTGKSSYLRAQYSNSIYFDLLESDIFLSLLKTPSLLREELIQKSQNSVQDPIIIDEIQKVPLLLDEVHWLIENKKLQFILCGSSARKLKRGHANLLGGRAWRYEMYPLVSSEIPDFNLLQALNRGLLPRHYQEDYFKKSLKAYVNDYLTEEIRAEGLTRNLPAFSKFLDAVAYSNGELVVYNNISSDCGVDSKTVKEYFEILVDTHLGYFLPPLLKKKGRKTITATPKFYLFDVGVANLISKTIVEELRGTSAGRSFEHFIFMELMAYRSYSEKDFELNFWRTKTGLEVDFIINEDLIYIESKISDYVKTTDLKGLRALIEEKKPKRAIVVCNEKRPRRLSGTHIEILPWKDFLNELWSNQLIK